jgi:hypothetical protein
MIRRCIFQLRLSPSLSDRPWGGVVPEMELMDWEETIMIDQPCSQKAEMAGLQIFPSMN